MTYHYTFNAVFSHEPGVVIAADDWNAMEKEAKKYVTESRVSEAKVSIFNKNGKLLKQLEYIQNRYHHWKTIKS